MTESKLKILEYKESLKEYIKRLNVEWLKKYFTVEPTDEVQLSDPQTHIIDQGGFIYFASVENNIVGTVTLMKVNELTYELSKMAVTEEYQGQGVGKRLLKHCIEKASSLGVEKLILYSNTKLVSAINLYTKYNFEEVHMDKTHYKRANIKMQCLIGNRNDAKQN